MNNSCAVPSYGCNCDKNDRVWREDSGLLAEKTKLPVIQLRFGDTGHKEFGEKGYQFFTASMYNLRYSLNVRLSCSVAYFQNC